MPRMKQLNPSTYEAALDLGASHTYAFFKGVSPDILPGVLSGFLMAFTMSLDDFIITHFTKGPGVDTLSTKIYTEVKKRYQTGNVRTIHHYIRNCIDFTFVSKLHTQRKEKEITFSTYILGGKYMKKFIALLLCCILTATALTG